jgi:putative membrane protein
MMPSDRRLHPLSILFSLGSLVRTFLVPGLLVLIGAGSAGWGWELWAMLLLIPYSVVAVGRYLTFRYRYEAHEMVVRTGFIFRNERHIPYARIQNLDAVQNLFHRLLGVVEARVETGGGQEPEAKMSVLPLADFEEMRRRVFAGRGEGEAPAEAAAGAEPAVPAGRTLLRLAPRELMLYGLIENRGFVLIAAAFGLLWEVGIADRWTGMIFGDQEIGRGLLRDLWRSAFGGGELPVGRIALTLAAFAGFLLLIRLVSMVWALLRLYGFQLTLAGGDLRTEYGLTTRVLSTIPLRRIQTLTIRETLLHRLFGCASVKVETAGAEGGEEGKATQREWLAPILRRDQLPGLLEAVQPGLDLAAVSWNAVHPRAFRRELKQWLNVTLPIALPLIPFLRWWTLALLPVLVAWSWLGARQTVKHLGWAVTGDAVLFRSGWLWRHVSVARFGKIQAVSMHESPFDRRAAMARVRVDTAGANELGHHVDIPYLARETARDLCDLLAAQAAQTAFRW